MNFTGLLDDLKACADTGRAAQMSAYMRNQFGFLGVQTPKRKEICKKHFKNAKEESAVDWSFVADCWRDPHRELQYTAVGYLAHMRDMLDARDIPRIRELAVTKSWWDTIDGLDRIVGNIALRHPDVTKTLLEWSVGENIWLRRIAIDHQLDRKTATDTALLEQILVNNLGQKEFFINKAIGWSLREYSKTNPGWVRDFLKRHADNLAALSKREAGKYLYPIFQDGKG